VIPIGDRDEPGHIREGPRARLGPRVYVLAEPIPLGTISMSTTPRTMPKLLKATYLGDTEYLLEETRATKLFYFPAPLFWTVVFGLFALLAAPKISSAVPTLVPSLTSGLTLSSYVSATGQMYLAFFWILLFGLGLLWLLILISDGSPRSMPSPIVE